MLDIEDLTANVLLQNSNAALSISDTEISALGNLVFKNLSTPPVTTGEIEYGTHRIVPMCFIQRALDATHRREADR